MSENNYCFSNCNNLFKSLDPRRTFCKKGCNSDAENKDKCKEDTCEKLCIKHEIGDGENKWGSWSKYFSRAPIDSKSCLEACVVGCINK